MAAWARQCGSQRVTSGRGLPAGEQLWRQRQRAVRRLQRPRYRGIDVRLVFCGGAGQTQGYGLNVAKRFPNIQFTIVGPNCQATEHVAQYDVRQAEIGFVAGAVAGAS